LAARAVEPGVSHTMSFLQTAVVGILLITSGQSIAGITPGVADHVLIEKAARKLTLFSNGVAIRTYRVALGSHPVGPKERQGDGRTPEGTYTIDSRLSNSSYHRALHISYPNREDTARAAKLGTNPGGDIMIHGIRNGLGWLGPLSLVIDWTKGCIAVTNPEIEEIWKLIPVGTAVDIKP